MFLSLLLVFFKKSNKNFFSLYNYYITSFTLTIDMTSESNFSKSYTYLRADLFNNLYSELMFHNVLPIIQIACYLSSDIVMTATKTELEKSQRYILNALHELDGVSYKDVMLVKDALPDYMVNTKVAMIRYCFHINFGF